MNWRSNQPPLCARAPIFYWSILGSSCTCQTFFGQNDLQFSRHAVRRSLPVQPGFCNGHNRTKRFSLAALKVQIVCFDLCDPRKSSTDQCLRHVKRQKPKHYPCPYFHTRCDLWQNIHLRQILEQKQLHSCKIPARSRHLHNQICVNNKIPTRLRLVFDKSLFAVKPHLKSTRQNLLICLLRHVTDACLRGFKCPTVTSSCNQVKR